jgi:OTT_1508-like deaminase
VLPGKVSHRNLSWVTRNQSYSLADTTTLHCKDEILTILVDLHRPRINARLQTRKSRRVVQEGLEDALLSLKKSPTSPQHFILITRLEILCEALRQYHSQTEKKRTTEDVKEVVLACYDFFKPQPDGQGMKAMLAGAGIDIDESRGDPHLRQVGKIATLCHMAELLSSIASHQNSRRLCVNIGIRYLPTYQSIQSPVPAVDGGSTECRIHAEVQLVVEFDISNSSHWNRPRVIGSSKAPCYLCELFINQHGQYLVPRTHGRLTPRWTIPDLNSFSASQLSQYRRIIKDMDCELQKPVTVPHLRRLDAAMSWQAFSQLNFVMSQPTVASHTNFTISEVQTTLPSLEAPLILNKGQTSAIGSVPGLGESNEPQQLLRKPAMEAKILPTGNHTENLAALCTSDSRLSEIVLLLTEAQSYLASNLPSCHSKRHSHGLRHLKQVRSSMSLGFKQSSQAARIIRDHESRACDMLFEGSMKAQVNMQHSNNMTRRINFHDSELFLEIDHSS